MYCQNCGSEMKEEDCFCKACGSPNPNRAADRPEYGQPSPGQSESESFSAGQLKTLSGKKRGLFRKIASALASLLFLFFLIGLFSESDSQRYIDIVRDGAPQYYDQVSFGDAFDNWFLSPKWSYDSDTRLVSFQGKCTLRNKPVTASVQFRVYDNGASETQSVELDDGYETLRLSDAELIYFYTPIFEDAYRSEGLEPPANMADALDSLAFLSMLFGS